MTATRRVDGLLRWAEASDETIQPVELAGQHLLEQGMGGTYCTAVAW